MGRGISTLSHINRSSQEREHRAATNGVKNPFFEEMQSISRLRRRSQHVNHCSTSTSIIEAVVSNNYEGLLILLDSLTEAEESIKDEVSSFKVDIKGWNVFHYAAHHQSDSIMAKLVEFLVDAVIVNEKSSDQGSTALHLTVMGETDDDRLVSALLKHPRIDVNVCDGEDRTPLHHACQRGFSKAVSALNLADFCSLDCDGDSPLHLAASNQCTAIFDVLSQCETFRTRCTNDPSFTKLKDSDGNTILHIAVHTANSSVIDWCLSFGFKVCSCNNRKRNCLHIAARRGDYNIAIGIMKEARKEEDEVFNSFVNAQSRDRSTPLYVAAKFGNLKIMELLLQHGAYMDAKTTMHFTPLLAAIRYSQPRPVSLLLDREANIMVKDRLKHYNPIMWAVEIQNPDILKLLLTHVSQKGLNDIWKIVDLDNNTAHHIAAKAKNADILKSLMGHNASCLVEKNNNGLTPFHIAVQAGKLSILNYIMSNYVNATYVLDANGSSGLHIAADAGHADIVDRLLRVRSSDNTIGTCDNRGWTPLHLAAKNGHHEALELLVEHAEPRHIEIVDKNHCTALYLACAEGRPKCVELLINRGAMVTYCYMKNNDEEEKVMSCLNAAIDGNHNAVVATILHSEKWQQALQYCLMSDPIKQPTYFLNTIIPVSFFAVRQRYPETPLRKLIKKMPGEAKLVFDRCISREKKLVEDEEGKYYTEEVHFNYDFIEDFQDLFVDHGSKVLSEPDPAIQLDNVTRKRKQGDVGVTGEGDMSEYLDHIEPTASPRVADRWGPATFHYQDHALHLMVLYKREELLKHALVASFIYQKWNLFGRWLYYPNIAFYTLLMLLLTVYMYYRFDYSKLIVDQLENMTNVSVSISDCSSNISLQSIGDRDVVEQLQRDENRLIASAVFIILICIARIMIEIYQAFRHVQKYFLSFDNYMEGTLYVATIVFVSNFQLQCLPSWVWQLGALCIFLSWINFMLFLREQPAVGIYVIMFQNMTKTFLRLTPMAFLLIMAFGQPFFMLLSVVELETPPQQFVTFPYSLLKTLSMITGELEIDRIFFATPSVITYPFSTYFLWILYLIIMPLLLQNLLVGLAVDDIKSVQEKAALKKEALQIAFILDIMNELPKWVIKRWNKREFTQSWRKGPLQKFWKWLNGSYWKPEFRTDSTKGHTAGVNMEAVCRTITSTEKRLQLQLNEQNEKLEKLMMLLSQEQRLSRNATGPERSPR